MTNIYLNKQQMLNIIEAHLSELHAEQYSHKLRIIEFDAAGPENIDQNLYNQISDMISQYDLRIQALQDEKIRVSGLSE